MGKYRGWGEEAFKMEIVQGDCQLGLLSDELKHKVSGRTWDRYVLGHVSPCRTVRHLNVFLIVSLILSM